MVDKLVIKELHVDDVEKELMLFHQEELVKHSANDYINKQDALIKELKSNLTCLRYDFANLTTKLSYRDEEISNYMYVN